AIWGICSPVADAQKPASPSPAKAIDPRAMALLQKSAKAMLALKTYQAECVTTLSYPRGEQITDERHESARLIAAKPNKMRYEQWELSSNDKTGKWTRDAGEFGITFVCDGKTHWRQYGAKYRTDTNTRPEMLTTILEPWDGFYSPLTSPHGSIDF